MFRAGRALGLLLVALPLFLRGAEPLSGLEIEALGPNGDFQFEENVGIVTDPAGVRVRYGGAELVAPMVRYNEQTYEVDAEGGVRIQREKEIWNGERIHYNFATRQMTAPSFRTGMVPFFVAGEGLHGDFTNRIYVSTNGFVTTDDVANPVYRVRAKTLTVVPGEYIEARGATVYLGRVPIMYWPVYRRHLDRHPNNFALLPGYRSLYGPYLLGSYNWIASSNLSGTVHLDYRELRGIAGGPDVQYDLGTLGHGAVRIYGTRDDKPGFDSNTNAIPSGRERVSFLHSATLRTNLTLKLVLHQQSDAEVIRDFFENEYRKDTQPKTFVEANQIWPNFSLNILAQPQVNDFFQTVERLPDAKLTAIRQQIGASPFYYESESSVAYLRLRSVDNTGTNYSALRADTFHQIVLPYTFFGWLNVDPRVGARFTHYGEIDGLGTAENDQDRGVFNTGAEVSTKASRVWPSVSNKLLDVSGIRHIVEPSIDYVYVPRPNVTPNQLPQFDSELQSFQLTPIEFPDYNSIDSIDGQNVMRFGLHNKLQTKRQDKVENLINWETFLDWQLAPRPGQTNFFDVFTDLDFRPRSWITFSSKTRFDIANRNFRLADNSITIEASDSWSWRLGHRYVKDNDGFGLGNNLITSSLTVRMNENWALRLTHHFEARDGTMEEQYYTLYRDLRSWTGALTFRVRDNRGGPTDVTVALTLSLKAFPRYGLGHDRETTDLLLGD